ncbi:MAG: YybH family protein [Gemmatimonadaceae bacterium]
MLACVAIVLIAPGCVLVAGPGASRVVPLSSLAITRDNKNAARTEIVAMMTHSAQSWNSGNLDAFVNDYEADTSTTYIGRRGIVRGRAAIREVYAPRFAPGGVRDSLSFENVEVDLLAPNVANVIAYYRLTRGDSTTSRGPTSLVMRRSDGRWRILHDHSS